MVTRLLIALLLSCATVHATITATDRGTGGNATTSTSLVIAPTTTLAAGSTGVIALSMDNSNGATSNLSARSYTDSKGNIWYALVEAVSAAANADTDAVIFYSVLTSSFASTDSLTLTLSPPTVHKTYTITELAPTTGNIVIPTTNGSAASNSTAAPTVSVNGLSNGDAVVGMAAVEWNDIFTSGGDTDTLTGTWSTPQHTGVGAASATGVSVETQTKIVTAYGQQTYNPGLNSTADVRLLYADFTETDSKARVVNSNQAAETTTTMTLTLPMATGSIGVIAFSADNQGASGTTQNLPTTLTDSASNSWTLRQTGIRFVGTVVGSGAEVGIYTSVLTSPLAVGATIPLTYISGSPTTPAKAYVVWEFAPAGAGAMTYVSGGMGTPVASTTPTVTTSSIASGDYVIGVAGAEASNSFVADTSSTNGAWKTMATAGSGLTTGGQAVISQWKKVTATATQTYSPTQAAANDTAIGWVQVHDSSVIGNPGAFLQLFP